MIMEKKMNYFSRSLHNLLTISGTDAAELAQALGVDLPEINRWLNGSAAPDVCQLQEIARRFGMPYSYFFESEQSLPNVPEVASWLGLSEETVETLLAMAENGPEEVMDALDDAIYAMATAVSAAGEVDAE